MIALIFLFLGCTPKETIRNGSLLSNKDYNELFPHRNNFFTYDSFTKAVNTLSHFKVKVERRGEWLYKITKIFNDDKSTVIRQDKGWEEEWAKNKTYRQVTIDFGDFCYRKGTNFKELAAFFAHVAHETRNGKDNQYNDGLMLVCEMDTNSKYVIPNNIYPAVANKKYYGRGPLQLSYNGNYGAASEIIFGDKNILLNHPEIVANNPVVSFESAIFFWMMPQGNKPSAHDVIDESWNPNLEEKKLGYTPGFGMTINIINGALECDLGEEQKPMLDRIGFYKHFLKKFNVDYSNCNCSCGKMAPYGK